MRNLLCWEVWKVARPSIFSSDYNERMRKRKIRLVLLVTLTVLACALFFAQYKYKTINALGSYMKNTYNNIASKKDKAKETDSKEGKSTGNKTTDKNKGANGGTGAQGDTSEDLGYAVVLSNGKQGKAVYQNKEGVKSFKLISPIESGIYYNISADGRSMVIFDDGNQNILCLDVEGKQTDITRTEYVSDDGTVYPKSDRLTKEPSYIWHSSPKFIDSENVAYISQLPWFNKEITKYVWIVNINDRTHRYIGKLSGSTVTFGELSEKGLNVKVDDKDFYLKGNGEISE